MSGGAEYERLGRMRQERPAAGPWHILALRPPRPAARWVGVWRQLHSLPTGPLLYAVPFYTRITGEVRHRAAPGGLHSANAKSH
jgi:hypothetical protein